MTVYNAASFSGPLNDSSISAANMENIVDIAINVLNMFGAATITNMNGGAAGSKTVTLTSKQAGAVFLAVRLIYRAFWIGPKGSTTLGQSISEADVLANSTIVETIKLTARRLSSISFVVAEDTSGIE